MLTFDPPVDLSGHDGIALDFEAVEGELSAVHLMLVEPSGAHYVGNAHTYGRTSRNVVFLFDDMQLLHFMAPDPDGRLDLSQIAAVKLGCNTTRDLFSFKVSRFELMKFER